MTGTSWKCIVCADTGGIKKPFGDVELCPNEKCGVRIRLLEYHHSGSSTRRTIIAFTGLAGAGKTTAAQYLVVNHGFTRVRFAGPLKNMLLALGLTKEQVDGSEKEIPCALLGGKTPRYFMQKFATEFVRDTIDANFWIRAWQETVARTAEHTSIVVDDLRFPNEGEMLHAIGGIIVGIERDGLIRTEHSSENYEIPCKVVIQNNGDLDHLYKLIDDLVCKRKVIDGGVEQSDKLTMLRNV